MSADILDQASDIETMERERILAMHRRCAVYGPSSSHCRECGDPIPAARQKALKGVTLCVDCQTDSEAKRRRGA